MKQINDIIYSAISTLLRPLVRMLLRNNIPLATFIDLAKRVYVEVAMEDFHLPNRKQSISRVALLTGLSRKEVLRVTRLAPVTDSGLAEQHNRSTRVVSGWIRDERFSYDGKPADLAFEGDGASFAELVKQYSGDITPRAVLDELLRGGLVQRLENGRLQLVAPAYLPQSEAEKMHILGSDTADLIGTIDHNLQQDQETPFFQRKVCYTRFPTQHLAGLRSLSREKAQRLLEELDRWMADHDQQDPEPDDDRQHRRAGLSIYYFESELQENDHHENEQ
jgi:hypothetical protein